MQLPAASPSSTLSLSPLWWPTHADEAVPANLPRRADAVVVGAGITGLSAAIGLARAGASVIVLESETIGFGGSTRSAGVIGRSIKKGFSQLLSEVGAREAVAIYQEVRDAFDYILEFIDSNGIECGLRHCGRFLAANSPEIYEAIARDLDNKAKYLGDAFEMVPRARQREQIGSDVYCGGAVIPDHKTLDPYLLHKGIEAVARRDGVIVAARTRFDGFSGSEGAFRVRTSAGDVQSSHLVVATNGYTGRELGWFRRRVIPLDAYMIATEPLPPALVQNVLPHLRTFNDYRIDTDYGRLAPDNRTLIFGGLTGRGIRHLPDVAARLRAKMVGIFPQLGDVRVAHVWTGNCAATFDLFPHIGRHEGVYYAMGYSFGSGLPLGLLYGQKIARRILRQAGGDSVLDRLEFRTRPFYTGDAWFLPYLMAFYRWRDRGGF